MVNAFLGKPRKPSDGELSAALGPTRTVWDQLLHSLSEEKLITGWEWHTYSIKAGWALRLQRKERNILYLAPGKGAFVAAMVFGDKALAVIRETRLPRAVMTIIESARKYAEGTGIRLEVKSAQDLPAIRKLVAIKVAH